VALLQVGKEVIFSLALRLLLTLLDCPAIPPSANLEAELLAARTDPQLSEALSALDAACGFRFGGNEESVAFALVGTVVKGLAHSTTKTTAKRLLSRLFDLSVVANDPLHGDAEAPTTRTVPLIYLVAVWPFLSHAEVSERAARWKKLGGRHQTPLTEGATAKETTASDPVARFTKLVSVRGHLLSSHSYETDARSASSMFDLVSLHLITDFTANLLGGLMLAYVRHIRSSQELMRLYTLVHHCITHQRTRFQHFLHDFADKLTEEYDNANTEDSVLRAAREAMQAVFMQADALRPSDSFGATRSQSVSSTKVLGALGFHGFLGPVTFQEFTAEKNWELWQAAYNVLDATTRIIAEYELGPGEEEHRAIPVFPIHDQTTDDPTTEVIGHNL